MKSLFLTIVLSMTVTSAFAQRSRLAAPANGGAVGVVGTVEKVGAAPRGFATSPIIQNNTVKKDCEALAPKCVMKSGTCRCTGTADGKYPDDYVQ